MSTKIKMVAGSEGNLDYMVLAKNKNHVLAVRSIIQFVPQHGAFIGGRLRACTAYTPGEMGDVEVGTPMETFIKGDFAESFPGLVFDSIDSVRGSVVVGVIIPRAPWQTVELKQAIGDVRLGLKVIGYARDRVPDDLFLVDTHVAAERLVEQWMNVIDESVDAVFRSPTAFIDPAVEVDTLNSVKAKMKKEKNVGGLTVVASNLQNMLNSDPPNAA